MESGQINFYREGDAYGCFSNFSQHTVDYKGRTWQTSEHAFQAMKFEGTQHVETVANASGPGAAAKLGRNRSMPLRGDWEEIKDAMMEEVVHAKFSQNLEIREILLGTGTQTLVEHTTNDSYWGDAGDGSGVNMLGKILMKVRDSLREG